MDPENALERRKARNHAAFHLHRAAEAFYKTVLLVLDDSQPKLHDLYALGNLCSALNPIFQDVFPQTTKADKHRLQLLVRAYTDARYDKKYTISHKELAILATSVRTLRDLTASVCKEFLAKIKDDSAQPDDEAGE